MILFLVVTSRGNSDVSGCGDYYVVGVALLTLQCSSDVIGLMGVALATSGDFVPDSEVKGQL